MLFEEEEDEDDDDDDDDDDAKEEEVERNDDAVAVVVVVDIALQVLQVRRRVLLCVKTRIYFISPLVGEINNQKKRSKKYAADWQNKKEKKISSSFFIQK